MQVNSRKDDIILEIGSQWLRMGLVGEKVQRKSVRSKSIARILRDPDNKIQNEMLMDELLCNIFFIYLNSSCQNKTVIILEKVYTPRYILELMANIMFNKLKIQKLEFCLSCVTPLYLTAKYSGVVVSSGYSCTEIMPVYDGYPLFRSYAYIDGGSSKINKLIRDELIAMNPQVPKDTILKMTDEQVTDIKNNYGCIPSKDKDITIPFKRLKFKFNQKKINFQIFYGDYENQEHNIAWSFLKMLDSVPVQCLEDLCRNVVFAGGLWRVDGMQNYFKREVSKLLKKFEKLQALEVRQKLSFVSWGFNPSQVAWIGCSIGASVRNIDHLCLKKSEFQEKGKFVQKIMESYFLSK